MKKEMIDAKDYEIKCLTKKYKVLDRIYVKMIYEFCEYDIKRSHKILTMIEEMKNPQALIETLYKKPEDSEEIFDDLEIKYNKVYGMDIEMETLEQIEPEGKKALKTLEYDFFQFIPKDCILQVMSFLEPYSFAKFSMTSYTHYSIGKSDAQSEYYKRLCLKLFTTNPPKFPDICRFEIVKIYVNQRPLDYTPNTRNSVNNNLRNYIWKLDMNSFNLQMNYYQKFGSYQSLFKRCPKINFNGYYICRHKYVRIGQKNEKVFITPIVIVYYYKYLRFMEDGSIIYHFCNRKLRKEQIIQFLSKKNLEESQKNVLIGEHIQYKQKIFVKTTSNNLGNQIFGYQFQLRSTDNKINNELKVLKYTLQLIDDKAEIFQTLYEANPKKEQIFFHYVYNDQIMEENSPIVRSHGI